MLKAKGKTIKHDLPFHNTYLPETTFAISVHLLPNIFWACISTKTIVRSIQIKSQMLPQ